MKHALLTSLTVTALFLSGAAFAAETSLCATRDQAQKVLDHYKANPGGLPFAAARTLGLNEAVIASSLPKAQSVGTSGTAFAQVWESMKGLDAVFLIMKGGNVFEVHTKIPGGDPSTRSKFFNLKNEELGLSGHLRPDLVSAIYAVAIPGKEQDQVSRAVLFMDATGETTFSVVAGGEGPAPSAATIAHFDKIVATVQAQSQLCMEK